MTRPAPRRYITAMRTLIAVLALLPALDLADIAGPARVIDGDTGAEAAMRADDLLDEGDTDGYAAWKRIMRAAEELLAMEPG